MPPGKRCEVVGPDARSNLVVPRPEGVTGDLPAVSYEVRDEALAPDRRPGALPVGSIEQP
jgi:hypothetical protein